FQCFLRWFDSSRRRSSAVRAFDLFDTFIIEIWVPSSPSAFGTGEPALITRLASQSGHTWDTCAFPSRRRQIPDRLVPDPRCHNQFSRRDDSFRRHSRGKSFWAFATYAAPLIFMNPSAFAVDVESNCASFRAKLPFQSPAAAN